MKNDDRKHLTTREIEKLIEAAKGSRNEACDRCLLLLMFRHGLRVSEACGLALSQVDIESRVYTWQGSKRACPPRTRSGRMKSKSSRHGLRFVRK